MIRMQHVNAIARAEARLTRRLARYWVFLGLSYLVALVFYFYYAFLHGLYSSYSASVGMISPRFLLGVIGLYYLIVFVVGAVFLAFDVRARDIRERVSEVLDSRPYTNLELLAGRFLGLLAASWIPIIALAVILEVLGLLLAALGSPVGEPMNITSLVSFVFLMVLPSLAFAFSLVFLVTLLVRNRLVAAVLVLALLGGAFWGMLKLPVTYMQLVDIAGFTSMNFPSDIIPAFSTLEGWLQRFATLLAAFGLLGISAAVHPRLDGGSRARLVLGGTGLIILALIFSGFCFYKKSADIKITETWKAFHAARADDPVPDLTSISGEARIDPGKALDMELDLTFSAPDQDALENALFTLNPGQKVTAVTDAAGRPIAFTHENGLLSLTLPNPVAPGEEKTVHISIRGLPDKRFAFLESAINPETMKSSGGGGNIVLLGTEPAVFDRRFVALMPAIRWLPASGTETGRDDPRSRPVDFFTVDLTVSLPDGWLAAGPGRRYKVEGDAEGERFRFSPGAPVPEVALIASQFESRGVEIEGVFMELLVYPKHMKNIEALAEAGEKIRSWIEERMREAKDDGLGYPYDGLTLAEVPSTLRTYGGGWRADSVMAPPGLLLMREIGFPLARFDTAFRDPDKFKDKEGGIIQAKWERLKMLFESDFSGDNIFTGAARNFLMYQTAAKGPEALALNYVMETLSSLLTTETTGYFSAHIFTDQKRMNQVINSTISNYFFNQSTQASNNIATAAITAATSSTGFWEKLLEVSLEDMDPWEDPARTVDVLTLKGNAVARSILDTLGRENTGRLLSSLREAHQGASYSFEELLEAGKAQGYDLDALLGDWFGSAALPGFVCSEAKVYRLPDSEDGSPRYQLLVSVRNDESAPGVFQIVQNFTDENGTEEFIRSKPIRMAARSAVRFGSVSSRPPEFLFLSPYLSLNRVTFPVAVSSHDPGKIEKVDAIEGLEEIPWALPEEPFVVVDDLDAGFQVLEGEKRKGLRISARENDDEETDRGLPIGTSYRIPTTWSRISMPGSWGKYRHTIVAVRAGEGDKKAIFTSRIPQAGQWDLEMCLPRQEFIYSNKKWGTWHLAVKDGNGDVHEIEFDSNATSEGWNLAGSLDLPEGEVSVTLSNKTDGKFVIADAIRWSPSAGK